MKAALCEKVVWEGADPFLANEALVKKASVYVEAGEPALAAETLNRVRMYVLSPEERKAVLLLRAECHAASQDYDQAIACLREAGVEVPEYEVRQKSDWMALFLSFIVPAGYAYAGEPAAGLLSTALNAGSIAWMVCNIIDQCYVSGFLGGAFALYYTFYGAQGRIQTLIDEYNRSQEEKAKSEAVRSALDSVSKE